MCLHEPKRERLWRFRALHCVKLKPQTSVCTRTIPPGDRFARVPSLYCLWLWPCRIPFGKSNLAKPRPKPVTKHIAKRRPVCTRTIPGFPLATQAEPTGLPRPRANPKSKFVSGRPQYEAARQHPKACPTGSLARVRRVLPNTLKRAPKGNQPMLSAGSRTP